jgi:hypothetical protein
VFPLRSENMFELYLALVVPRFTEALRDRRVLVLLLGESLVCFRAKDCSVVATILPSTDPILRDVVTSRLWSGAMSSSFDSSIDWTVRFGLFLDGGDFLWLQAFERFGASYSFPPTDFYNRLSVQDGQ